ncbi:ABC transporter substrate-binding protein [Sulfolobus acidocaldarius SUSAZ]|nr:ABC transporter substrate-binding protein [Sulfolobus acidocaldarius SUSAZ]
MSYKKALTRIQAILIVVIIVIAVVGVAVYFLSQKPSSSPASSSSTSSSSNSASSTSQSGNLVIYGAGAYAAILNYLASQFQNQTGIQTHVNPGGSFALASQISQGSPVDVFVPVAFIQAIPLEGSQNPGWTIAFLSDQMTIVYSNYTESTPYWNQLYSNYTMAMKTNQTQYWYNFFYLLSTKFSLGIANPNTDPEGLYAYLILNMAGYLYANHNTSYFTDLVKANPNVKSATTTAAFVSPLKAGELDFTFSYVSYAVSQKLDYLKLPPWLSFGYYPNETQWYSQFSYNITVSGKTLTIHGNPVYLYITVPLTSTNPNAAYQFIEFILSHHSELSQFGVTPVYPAVLFYNNLNSLPQPISQLLQNGELKYGGTIPSI